MNGKDDAWGRAVKVSVITVMPLIQNKHMQIAHHVPASCKHGKCGPQSCIVLGKTQNLLTEVSIQSQYSFWGLSDNGVHHVDVVMIVVVKNKDCEFRKCLTQVY